MELFEMNNVQNFVAVYGYGMCSEARLEMQDDESSLLDGWMS